MKIAAGKDNKSMQFIDLKKQYALQKASIDARIQKVLDHNRYIMGPEVRELEERLEAYTGASHCISVSSGTEALLISLMALGIGPGDEVITTPFTFAATAEVVALVGATPVFVDIEPDTCNIDVSRIEAAISETTKAIMPVSLYGQPADMDEINAIASCHDGVFVIEDAAQSFGSTYKGRKSCNLSDIGCVSFFPSKPLGCYGDGGAIFTSDGELAKAMREIRVHGQDRRYHHARIGVGGRMDTIQCAIVLAKMETFEEEVEQRIKIGARYLDLLSNVPGVRPITVRDDRTSVWAQFTIKVDARDEVVQRLSSQNVPTAVHYPIPLHKQPAYETLCRIDGVLDESEKLSEQVLSLPMHPYLDEKTQREIVGALVGT